jgi:hypothetical protein
LDIRRVAVREPDEVANALLIGGGTLLALIGLLCVASCSD